MGPLDFHGLLAFFEPAFWASLFQLKSSLPRRIKTIAHQQMQKLIAGMNFLGPQRPKIGNLRVLKRRQLGVLNINLCWIFIRTSLLNKRKAIKSYTTKVAKRNESPSNLIRSFWSSCGPWGCSWFVKSQKVAGKIDGQNHQLLVGGFNPFWKILDKMGIFPKYVKKCKIFETTT